MTRPLFQRYIGIDYSGAGDPDSRLSGLRVFMATGERHPVEILPPDHRSQRWTRRGVATWLVTQLDDPVPVIAGIDHSFSFPDAYFTRHGLAYEWDVFLDDLCKHWPTDTAGAKVDDLRREKGARRQSRTGDSHWRRIAEVRCRAKSVFHFDVPGSVAKSTHAGLPWLRFIRQTATRKAHFWPYDGWDLQRGRSVVTEVYPALCQAHRPTRAMTQDQADAYAAAAWLRHVDRTGTLRTFLTPALSPQERTVAAYEGWILGVR